MTCVSRQSPTAPLARRPVGLLLATAFVFAALSAACGAPQHPYVALQLAPAAELPPDLRARAFRSIEETLRRSAPLAPPEATCRLGAELGVRDRGASTVAADGVGASASARTFEVTTLLALDCGDGDTSEASGFGVGVGPTATTTVGQRGAVEIALHASIRDAVRRLAAARGERRHSGDPNSAQ